MITGKTRTLGIIGWPVSHSLSPVMHNAAFTALALDYSYIPLPIHPDYLEEGIKGLKSMGFVGANVTIPHKVTIMPYLDELDHSAQLAGAVNTIVIKEGKSIGYNTDAQGFVLSLLVKNITLKDKFVVIMGAGGAARAVVSGLLSHSVANIMIGTRNAKKAAEFIQNFPTYTNLQGCNWDEPLFHNAMEQCDILINCTPIGMETNSQTTLPIIWGNISNNAVICDLIYNPPLTQFLADAQNRGHLIINGAGMLIEQGALAFELWTGKNAPRQIMAASITKLI